MVEEMRDNKISKKTISETLFVFESVYNDLLEAGIENDTQVNVRVAKIFGETRIRLMYQGEVYVPVSGNVETTEDIIMQAFADKIHHSYFNGYNNIYITVQREYSRALFQGFAALALGIVVYAILRFITGQEFMQNLDDKIIFPLEVAYANCVLMVGAPVTFFSLLSHVFNAYIASGSARMRRIQFGAIVSSIFAIVLATVMSALLSSLLYVGLKGLWLSEELSVNVAIDELIKSLVPTSIFSPFDTLAPFPLILLTLLTAFALCSSGEYFEKMKGFIDAGYALFSRMLTAVVYVSPLFCFLAIIDMLIDAGVEVTAWMVLGFILIMFSTVVLIVFYFIRLDAGGVKIKPFVGKLGTLLRENLSINSSIDAVPFNIRYCTIEYGMNKEIVKEQLPILAQINLDGNCYYITLTAMTMVLASGGTLSWFQVVAVGLLVLMLSLGAPNQPGSCLIGMVIIINYMDVPDFVPVAILTELLLGSWQNLINVFGDIVAVAIDDAKSKS